MSEANTQINRRLAELDQDIEETTLRSRKARQGEAQVVTSQTQGLPPSWESRADEEMTDHDRRRDESRNRPTR